MGRSDRGSPSRRPKRNRQGVPFSYPRVASPAPTPLLAPSKTSFGVSDTISINQDSPYPVFGSGLLTLFEPEPANRLESPAVELTPKSTLSFGVTKEVEVEDGATPEAPIPLIDFLVQPGPKPKPTRKAKAKRMLHLAWLKIWHPSMDPKFAHLPQGFTNRIRMRDPIRDKVRRLMRNLKSLPKIKTSMQYRRPDGTVPAPSLRPIEGMVLRQPRECPKIRPGKPDVVAPMLDPFQNPAGREFDIFFETANERNRRLKNHELEIKWREMSDEVLQEQGRPQIKDPSIGRAPPLSKRVLTEIQIKKTPELLVKTPKLQRQKHGEDREEQGEVHNAGPLPSKSGVEAGNVARRRDGSPHVLGIKMFSNQKATTKTPCEEEWEEIELNELAPVPKLEIPTPAKLRESKQQQFGNSSNQSNTVQTTCATLVQKWTTTKENSEPTENDKQHSKENETETTSPRIPNQQQSTTPIKATFSSRVGDSVNVETPSTKGSVGSIASSRDTGLMRPFKLPILVNARQAIAEQRLSTPITNNKWSSSQDSKSPYSPSNMPPSMRNGQWNADLPLRNMAIGQSHTNTGSPLVDNLSQRLAERETLVSCRASLCDSPRTPTEQIQQCIGVHGMQSQNSSSDGGRGTPASAAASPYTTQPSALAEFGLAQRQRRLSTPKGPRFPVRPSLPGGSSEEANVTCTLRRSRRVSSARGRYPVRPQRELSTEESSKTIVTPNTTPIKPPSPVHIENSRDGESGVGKLLDVEHVSVSQNKALKRPTRMPSLYDMNKDYGPPPPIPPKSAARKLRALGQGQAGQQQQQQGGRGSDRQVVQFDGPGNRNEQSAGRDEQAKKDVRQDRTSRPQLAVPASKAHDHLQEPSGPERLPSPIDVPVHQPPIILPTLEFFSQHLIANHLPRVAARVGVPAATAATRRVPVSPIPREEYNGTIWPTFPNLTLNPHLPPHDPSPAFDPDATLLSHNPTSQDSSRSQPAAGYEARTAIASSSRPPKIGEEFSLAYKLGQLRSLRFFKEETPSSVGAIEIELDTMDNLQVRPVELSSIKAKAVEDARQMQAQVIDICTKAGKDPPKYALLELIGKGTFGRVYKGKDMTSAAIVAVKIIDIDESDTVNPRQANTYSEFLKEVSALKILSESKARNINHVIEALPVGQAMWMITEHCGGGSIATLMKPTAPGGLQEKWIVPIAREVAEGLKWVHQADIIHRDIKCANILITEEGGVQLCDFGVAGVVEGTADKRSTIIGTPHWMAPELFTAAPSYGKEVDIWAFGCMVYEMATGLPPNVANGIAYPELGEHLKKNVPRLEGGKYSDGLRDTVAYCLEEIPSARPPIEQVQRHPYIANTSARYPTSSLTYLVRAFKMWENHGGSRQSLFMAGGAQGPSELVGGVYGDEWNFSTTAVFDQEVSQLSSAQDVYDAYGTGVVGFNEDTTRPKGSRRRPPPEALSRLPPPLVKVFDPNTLSSYEDNSRNHYGRPTPPPTSDLPLRDDSARITIRDTMIDLGGHDPETGLSSFPDMDTIRAGARPVDEDDVSSTMHDFSRPALSDPADMNPNRRTQDWKFPSMAPPASADPEVSRFPSTYDVSRPAATPGSSGRPALVHHPTEPTGGQFGGLLSSGQAAPSRASMAESLIDLDMSMPDPYPDVRPSTANSDAGSTTSEQMTSVNPFEFEGRVSYQAPVDTQEPAFYLNDDGPLPTDPATRTPPRDITEISDFSASDAEISDHPFDSNEASSYEPSGFSDSEYVSMPRLTRPFDPEAAMPGGQNDRIYTMGHFPPLPDPPSAAALAGTASREEMINEVSRALGSMTAQLEAFRDTYDSPTVVQTRGSRRR